VYGVWRIINALIIIIIIIICDKLIHTLQHQIGINGTALSWFSSYLVGRSQSISVKGQLSDTAHLTCGVPQGSVLGPILFVLYMSSLANVIDEHHISHYSYADDTQLIDQFKPEHFAKSLTKITNCTKEINDWMTSQMLKLNDDKTEVLIGSRHQLLKLQCNQLTIADSQIDISKSLKNLGV